MGALEPQHGHVEETDLPLPGEHEEAGPRAELSAAEALERIRRGEPLRNVRIHRLTFRGEFTEPVDLQGVLLVQARFEKVTFRGPVAFTHCTLDRPRFSNGTVFEQGLSLVEATLVKA